MTLLRLRMATKVPPGLGPKVIRGTMTVEIDGQTLEYPRVHVTTSGVSGLKWPPLVPAKHFGKPVVCKVDISTPNQPCRFEVAGTITREMTARTERMGVKFHFRKPEIRNTINSFIEKSGVLPTDYTRKFPRIPSRQFTEEFKLAASVLATATAINPSPKRVSFQLGNLSPEGLLLSTRSDEARAIRPGDLVDIRIVNEGGILQFSDLRLRARISRITHELDPAAREEIWSLGVQFYRLEEHAKESYFKILETILKSLRAA